MSYQLRVLNPDGSPKTVLDLDPPGGTPLELVGGVRRMEVSPLGDCREATFEGNPASLGIGPRDTVQIRDTQTGRNVYAGTAVITGSTASEVGKYKLQGLRYRRLAEVEVRKKLVEADLGAQIRQMFVDVIASGQLGTTLQAPAIANLGVTSAALAPNWWHVDRLMDERLRGRANRKTGYSSPDGSTSEDTETPDWGVTADLVPVFGWATGIIDVPDVDGVEVDGLDLDSSTLVSDVRVMFTKMMSASRCEVLVLDGSPRGTTYTDDLRAGRPIQYPVSVAARTWGQSWRTLPLGTAASLFEALPGNSVELSTVFVASVGEGPVDPPTVAGDETALWDNDSSTAITISAPAQASGIVYALKVTFPSGTALPDGFFLAVDNATVELAVVASSMVIARFSGPTSTALPLYLLPGAVRDERLGIEGGWESSLSLTVQLRHTDLTRPVTLSAATLARADQDLLLAAAAPLARTPTLNPVTARVPGWNVVPAAQASVLGRLLPVSLIVYDMEDDGTKFTEIRCGQRDDAERLSFVAAVADRDHAATLAAVDAST